MKALVLLTVFLAASVANGQDAFSKIADNTIKYVKAGTFGKPDVAKKTTKVALGQVRVHYKTVTSRASATRNNAADVTVYLDGEMTNGDLQQLTDEFYQLLTANLSKIGIASAPFDSIKGTEYYIEREKSQEDKKAADHAGKNGQAWVSFTAFDGPVLMRWTPEGIPEIAGYSKMKKMSKTAETVGGDLMTIDVVVDFASISLKAEVKQDRAGWLYSDPYFHSDYSIAGLMSVPQSYIFMVTQKNGFDQYQSALPVAERYAFSDKPREDSTRAAFNSAKYFNGERHSFTPLVIPAKRDLYIAATRQVLKGYAEILAEKFRIIRSGEKPSDKVAQNPVDTTSLQQVNDEAKKKNDTTAVTTGEITAAAEQAIKEGKFRLAADYYSELIKKDPANFAYYMRRGALYLDDLKDYKAAIKDFDEMIRLNPNEATGYYNRGTAYIRTSDWKKAKKDLDSVIVAMPGFVSAWLNRGIVLLNMKQNDAALADFNQGIKISPRTPGLYRARAVYYQVIGNAALAQADELRAAQLERGQ